MSKQSPTFITYGKIPFTFRYNNQQCVVFTDRKARSLTRDDLFVIAQHHRTFYIRLTGITATAFALALFAVYLIH